MPVDGPSRVYSWARGVLGTQAAPRSVDIDVHLLADVDLRIRLRNGVNHLHDPGVDTFGVVPGQRLLWSDIGLKADELQGDADRGVATNGCVRSRVAMQFPRLVFIYIHANVEDIHIAK